MSQLQLRHRARHLPFNLIFFCDNDYQTDDKTAAVSPTPTDLWSLCHCQRCFELKTINNSAIALFAVHTKMQFSQWKRKKVVLFLMFSFSKTLIFLLLIKFKNAQSIEVADKIVSGHPANAGEFPFMVFHYYPTFSLVTTFYTGICVHIQLKHLWLLNFEQWVGAYRSKMCLQVKNYSSMFFD